MDIFLLWRLDSLVRLYVLNREKDDTSAQVLPDPTYVSPLATTQLNCQRASQEGPLVLTWQACGSRLLHRAVPSSSPRCHVQYCTVPLWCFTSLGRREQQEGRLAVEVWP